LYDLEDYYGDDDGGDDDVLCDVCDISNETHHYD
jgi:hypothetical protein